MNVYRFTGGHRVGDPLLSETILPQGPYQSANKFRKFFLILGSELRYHYTLPLQRCCERIRGLGSLQPDRALLLPVRACGLQCDLVLRDDTLEPGNGSLKASNVFEQALAGQHKEIIAELRVLEVDLK